MKKLMNALVIIGAVLFLASASYASSFTITAMDDSGGVSGLPTFQFEWEGDVNDNTAWVTVSAADAFASAGLITINGVAIDTITGSISVRVKPEGSGYEVVQGGGSFTFKNSTTEDTWENVMHWQWKYTPQETTPVPLPAAGFLLGSGLLGLAGIRKRRRAKRH